MTFDSLIDHLKEKVNNVEPIGSKIGFDFDELTMAINGKGATNEIEQNIDDCDCVIKISKENFIKLTQGELNPMTAIMLGKIKIKGDMAAALKLQHLLK